VLRDGFRVKKLEPDYAVLTDGRDTIIAKKPQPCNMYPYQLHGIENSTTYAVVGDGFNTLRGVAPGCKWAGVKVLKHDGTGNSADMGEGIDDAIAQRMSHKIKVANMSFGLDGDPVLDAVLRGKVNTMVNNGIVAVCSAGNDGPRKEAKNEIDDPGRAGMAITVAGTEELGALTTYSSSGFANPGATEDNKPDLMAPGGSYDDMLVLSADTNDADAADANFADVQANDYTNKCGTSMAAGFVSGAAALVIQALDENGLNWDSNSSSNLRLVRMLLCATCTECNCFREWISEPKPTLGGGANPKDLYDGYGNMNVGAAIEAVKLSYAPGETISGTLGSMWCYERATARNVNLVLGTPFSVKLDVPDAADFDMYLYSSSPDAKGNPVLLSRGCSEGAGADEMIFYKPKVNETGYLVIKWVSGEGDWTLSPGPDELAAPPNVGDDGAFTTHLDRIHGSWLSQDDYGISAYSYAISTTPTEPAIVPGGQWMTVGGTTLEATRCGLHLIPGQTAGQKGIAGASGLKNIGMLVKVWRPATLHPTNPRRFSISDGSGVDVMVEVGKTLWRPYEGRYVVTGISSCCPSGPGLGRRARVSNREDMAIVNQRASGRSGWAPGAAKASSAPTRRNCGRPRSLCLARRAPTWRVHRRRRPRCHRCAAQPPVPSTVCPRGSAP